MFFFSFSIIFSCHQILSVFFFYHFSPLLSIVSSLYYLSLCERWYRRKKGMAKEEESLTAAANCWILVARLHSSWVLLYPESVVISVLSSLSPPPSSLYLCGWLGWLLLASNNFQLVHQLCTTHTSAGYQYFLDRPISQKARTSASPISNPRPPTHTCATRPLTGEYTCSESF